MDMQYIVLEAKSAAQLSMMVNSKIEDGWIPQGGVCLAIDQGNYTYCQAMMQG